MKSGVGTTIPKSTLLKIILILPLFLLIKKARLRKSKSRNNLPPGPWKLPIIGSIHHLIGEHPHCRLSRLSMTYGPLLHLKLGEINLIAISSPDLACEVMKTQDINFASRPQIMVGKTIFYNCTDILFAPYGKYWSQLRKVCSMNLFSAKRVKSFGFIREEIGNILMEKIRAAAGSKVPVNLTKLFLFAANTSVSKATFGKECAHQESFFAAMKEISMLSSGFDIVDVFPSLGFLGKISGMRSRMVKAHRNMDAILSEIIEEHQARRVEGDDIEEDIVHALLGIMEQGDLDLPLTMDNVKAVVLDLFMAGTDTSSGFLDWVMSELIRHPEVMQKVQSEVRKTLSGRTKVEESDANELQYLNCVIKEAFRLHPPAPLLARFAGEAANLSGYTGYTIPAGSRVMINARGIMRDPEYWEDPESFRPERFGGSALDFKGGSFEYLPFGSGRRICPGMTFGLANIEQWLARLLLSFDWSMPEGKMGEDLDMEEAFGGTVTRKSSLWLLATPCE